MPTTATSPRTHRRDPSDDVATTSRSLPVRLRVALKRGTLTRELEAGAPPGFSPELALCASQLMSDRRRRQLARTWRRTLHEVHHPAITRSHVSIIRRGAVIEAEEAINALIARLSGPEPVAVRGMAMLERLMTDGASSPLFSPAEPGTLRRQILLTTEALDREPVELPLAA
jgi:hypothetical protein